MFPKVGDFVRGVQGLPAVLEGGPDLTTVEGVYVGLFGKYLVLVQYGPAKEDVAKCYKEGLFPVSKAQMTKENLELLATVHQQLGLPVPA